MQSWSSRAATSGPPCVAVRPFFLGKESDSDMGPIDINCDAPPFSVVKACEKLGFRSPLDVRWCRMSHFVKDQRERGFHLLLWLLGNSQPSKANCICGQILPLMEPHTFTFASEKEAHFLLGQCCRCRTMFWEEAPVPSR
jgi:hypothetical protein